MLSSPDEERLEGRTELAPLRRQHVLGARRVLLVETTRDDGVLFEVLEARRERIGTYAAQGRLELLEAPRWIREELTQDEDRPAVPDDVERPCDRAGFGGPRR